MLNVQELADSILLQEDLDSMYEWSYDLKLRFKGSKSVHVDSDMGNLLFSMPMSNNELQIPVKSDHRDLELMFSSDLTCMK